MKKHVLVIIHNKKGLLHSAGLGACSIQTLHGSSGSSTILILTRRLEPHADVMTGLNLWEL